jgi:NAD(P)-dependent dehydrogenase (short-subunit alcohol dehydrogenase family)
MNKTVLITGATSGHGLEASVKLARMGADVVMVARKVDKGLRAVATVKKRSGSQTVAFMSCDLGSQASIRSLARQFCSTHATLDVLINNAAIGPERREITEDGIEKNFAVNHLSYFLLTNLLLDLLKRAGNARVVNVSSAGHREADMDFDNLQYQHGGYTMPKAYRRSKLANILFTNELARRLAGTGVTANSLHPGAVVTHFWSRAPGAIRPLIIAGQNLSGIAPKQGNDVIVEVATSPALEGQTGLYFERNGPVEPAPLTRDEALAKRLWDVSAKLVGWDDSQVEMGAPMTAATGATAAKPMAAAASAQGDAAWSPPAQGVKVPRVETVRVVKEKIQRLIHRYPAIKRSRLYYEVQRIRQDKLLRHDPSHIERQDVLDGLVNNGIFVIPEFLAKDVCDTILREIEPTLEKTIAGTCPDGLCLLEGGPYRVGHAERYSETARKAFYENEFIRNVAEAFVSKKVVSYRREIDLKVDVGRFLDDHLPHFDDWRHRFKAFLYLHDVTEKQAPFGYYEGSHKMGPWKERYAREFEADGEEGRYGNFFPREMRRLLREEGFKERICTGPAGTLILADFRGIHKGTMLHEGRRVMLNNCFEITIPGLL